MVKKPKSTKKTIKVVKGKKVVDSGFSPLSKSTQQNIQESLARTSSSGKEVGFPFCSPSGRSFSSKGIKEGTSSMTYVESCPVDTDKKVGDFHSHPYDWRKGIPSSTTPSINDFYANIYDSHYFKNRQVSCVATPKSKNVHCFRPKTVPDKNKVAQYRNGLTMKNRYGYSDYYSEEPDPKHIEIDKQIGDDFEHIYYSKKDYNRTTNPVDIVTDSMGTRFKWFSAIGKKQRKDINKPKFCKFFIQNYNAPHNAKVGKGCESRLNSWLPEPDFI